MSDQRIQEIIDDLRAHACGEEDLEYEVAFEAADLIESLQRETEPLPQRCEVIKFARAGEKSNKLFSAHIFPEDQILTVEVRAYNGGAQPMAGDHIPRSEYEKYDPFLVFEFYQKDSVVSLRDTCNWIIDTLEEKEKDAATEPKGEATT